MDFMSRISMDLYVHQQISLDSMHFFYLCYRSLDFYFEPNMHGFLQTYSLLVVEHGLLYVEDVYIVTSMDFVSQTSRDV